MTSLRDQISAALSHAISATQGEVGQSTVDITRYIEGRAAALALAYTNAEPGLDQARAAAVDAVVLYAAIKAVGQADQLNARFRGIIDLGLRFISNTVAAALLK